MSRLSRVSEISEESSSTSSSGRAPNFSRPHPQRYDFEEIIIRHPRRPYSNVHAISAFHEPNRDLPDEPRFSEDSERSSHAISAFHEPNRHLPDEPRFSQDSERTGTTTSNNSAGSEFAWDGQKGELAGRRRSKQVRDQRYSGQPRSRPTTAKTATSDTSMSAFANPKASSSSRTTKKVSIDVQSDTTSMMTNDQHEDTASHHTVSDDENTGSFDNKDEWRSSDYDTTGLSDAKIRKLLKKGVNPSLYAEMQAAKKNRKSKWIGPLVGNSFIG